MKILIFCACLAGDLLILSLAAVWGSRRRRESVRASAWAKWQPFDAARSAGGGRTVFLTLSDLKRS